MNVSLPQDLEKYVESLLKTGKYNGSSEVIEEALRQHQVSRPTFEVVMTPQLERLLDEGIAEIEEAKTTEQLRRDRGSQPGSANELRGTRDRSVVTTPPATPKPLNGAGKHFWKRL